MGKIHCIILDKEQLPLAKATLMDIKTGRAYFALRPGSYQDEELGNNETVIVRMFDTANGLETYHGRVDRLNGGILEVVNLQTETHVERRADVKVFVNRPVYIITEDAEEGVVRKSKGVLRDISAGGACIIAAEDIPEDGYFEMVFDLLGEADVLPVGIIRKDALDTDGYSYGCRFIDLHPSQESRVREYVFKRHLGLIGRNTRT